MSAARHKTGTVVANPYMPELAKNIVVRAGPRDSGQWLTETRDLASDFRRAFGRDPGEPVTAYYERIACN